VIRAYAYLKRTAPGTAQRQLLADLRIVEASDLGAVDPAKALILLDSSLAFFAPPGVAASATNPVKLTPLYVARANAWLTAGQRDSAQVNLAQAARQFDRKSESTASVAERGAVALRARAVSERLVSTLVASGKSRDALIAAEWGRVAFTPRRDSVLTASGRLPRLSDPALSLTLVGDSLFAWTIVGDSVAFRREVVSRSELNDLITRSARRLESGDVSAAAHADLARLFDLLVRPSLSAIGDTATLLTIVADDELSRAPFAAFWDSRSKQYLFERVALRFTRLVWGARPPSHAARREVVSLIADPTFHDERFPLLGPLAAARDEVRGIESIYGRSRIVEGDSAGVGALVRELQTATVAHFAGHTVFDERRPERSFLAASDGMVTAAQIGRLELRGLELAVLSTCEASRAARTRGAGFTGIGDAFIGAGARGVVGAMWRVRDDWSAKAMVAFHREYASSRNAARALRAMQLDLLRAEDAALRSPAAWAAYRYTTISAE
jgi:CHAT domain-containing protein